MVDIGRSKVGELKTRVWRITCLRMARDEERLALAMGYDGKVKL